MVAHGLLADEELLADPRRWSGLVDGILQKQAAAEGEYFIAACGRRFDADERQAIAAAVLRAYRWQYIVSGVQDGRFLGILTSMITPVQTERITKALAPLM